MSAEKTHDIITAYIAAFNASDNDAMLALLHDDVAHDINQGDREIGKEKFRWFNVQVVKNFDEEWRDVVIMVAPGGVRAAAEFTMQGKYVATAEGLPDANGQSYSLRAGIFFEIDDGLITRVSHYYNRRDWLTQIS